MLTRVSSDLPANVEATLRRVIGVCLEVQGISFAAQQRVDVFYKECRLNRHRLDFVIESSVVLEIKAVSQSDEIHVR